MVNKTLKQLYEEHEGKVSDKWSLYLTEYDRIFSEYRNRPVKILEIGIQNGGSLDIWTKYFKSGERFIGCDINPDCSRLNYEDPRVSLVVGDANTDSVQKEILGHCSEFDIIIDDGSHISSDIIKSFARYFPCILDGGVFVAEDLHCSYWQEYEGGLYDPFSSISFFKALADIINFEHWGVDKSRDELLNGFRSKYDFAITDELLERIHSVVFINSVCIVRKTLPQDAVLGSRYIAGEVESVVEGHDDVRGNTLKAIPQINNFWSMRDVAPAEELIDHLQALSDSESELDQLNKQINQQINQLNKTIAKRDAQLKAIQITMDEMQQSISWRIAEPVRFAGKLYRFLKANGYTIFKMMLTLSGWRKILNKIKIIVRGQTYRFVYRIKYKFRKKLDFEKQGVSKVPRGRIIVVSHNANKEGAPLLALNIVQHLNNNFNYDVVTILASGGDLIGEFKKVSTVYRYDLLRNKEIAELCDGLKNDGFELALCNTSVVGSIVEALNNAGVRCTTLVHELPYVVKIANLQPSIHKIISNSEVIVFPARYVKNKLESLFEFDGLNTYIRHQGRYMSNPHLFDKEKAKIELRQHLGCDRKTKLVIGIGYGEYRKGIDLFVETGIKVASTTDDVLFVWVGDCKILESEKVQGRIKQQGCQDIFKFIGYEKDIGLYYSGADVFFLSSREDPFPSVYIDAISAGLPVVAFDDAGGFVEFQKKINGILVSDLNADAAAEEISHLLFDANAYQQYENTALAAAKEFGFNSYLYDLLEFSGVLLQKVTVIIPNYNYEQYIEGRLKSIIQQTVKPFEIILLDDNSQDNSLAVARELLENSGIDYSVLANKENNGCYKQWLKGISLAKGDFVWIAEADDLCRPDFLEKLLPKFDDNTNLVYCQSIAIDKNSDETDFSYLEYTKEFSETRWCNDFTNNGENEIIDYLVRMNTIPNASGVIMRKSALDGIDRYLKEFTSTGDWLTYVYVLSSGGISYVSEKLNYHRRHDNSIIHTVMHEPKLLKEIILVSRYILKKYEISDENKRLLVKRFNDYYALISSGKASLSEDEMFKSFFHENGLDDLWGYVLKT